MSSSPPGALERAVGRWEIVGLAVNDVVGSGIYLLPAAAAAYLGGASLWAVIAAGVAVLLIVLCFAEASSYFDQPGSAYLYTRTAFGDFLGFEVGWMTWLARVASVAALAVGFAQAVSYLWPAASTGAARAAVIVLPVVGLTWINMLGVRAGARTAVVLAIAKVIPLFVFVGAGVWVVSAQRVAAQAVTESGGLGGAALLLLYAYAGFENTPAAAGEYKNPKRDVPFALLVHIGFVTLLYALVQWVALGTVERLGETETPLADAAGLFLGSWGGALLTVGAAVSILGTNGNTVFAGPRYLYALARDGYGPRFLGRVHPRYRTPAWALVTQTAIALPLALTGSFVGLAALSVVARLATYLGTIAALPVLRRKLGGQLQADGFRLPGGIVIPLAAAAVTLALAASASRANLIAGAVALVAGLGVYALRRRPAADGRNPPAE